MVQHRRAFSFARVRFDPLPVIWWFESTTKIVLVEKIPPDANRAGSIIFAVEVYWTSVGLPKVATILMPLSLSWRVFD